MKTYDLILVYALSRVHTHYLSILRHLGRRLRIGVVTVDTAKIVKTAETERLFMRLCREFGAEIMDGPVPATCRLLVVPQFRYQAGVLDELTTRVRSDRRVVLQTFGHGVENLEAVSRVGIETLYVYDAAVFGNKLKTEAERRFVNERFSVVEMGSPFLRYPVFEAAGAVDYLVAFPTDLSFRDPGAKASFAANVNRLIDTLPAGTAVVLKLHNVSDGGRLSERESLAFRFGERLGALGIRSLPTPRGSGRHGLGRFAFGIEYHRLARRLPGLDTLTPHFNLGLELFLPWVRRGLVTGRSSVVWYALLNRLPVYNCDDETQRARSDGVLDSYRAFGIPPCGGRADFDPRHFDRISDGVRQADLLDLLQKEL